MNPYTVRLFRRIDFIIHFLLCHKPYWVAHSGHLCTGNGTAKTYFPDWSYRLGAAIQNRWFWTRRILSA